MAILEVNQLTKKYPAFTLDHVSFQLEQGKITGFIGRNGAGKSTTLKSLFQFVHPDKGTVKFFDLLYEEHENEIKQQIGFVAGGVNFYPQKKLKSITKVTKQFYQNWDDDAYKKYTKMFQLDENKTPAQLSEGMKVKYSLALALSHNAKLLILDEPTSGLDPVSRDDLLDVFLTLQERGITILFSTHITTDLDKCADNIIYIRSGKIVEETGVEEFIHAYKTVELTKEEKEQSDLTNLIGLKRSKHGFSAIVKAADANTVAGNVIDSDLETIMVHMEKEEQQDDE